MVQRKRFAITIATSIGFALLSALVVMLKPASATFIQNQQPPQESSTAAEYQSLSSPQTVTVTTLFVENSSPTPLGETTTFTAVISATLPITYQWDFGDGVLGVGMIATHTYTAPGTYSAIVTAIDATSSVTSTTQVTIIDGYKLYLPVIFHSALPRVNLGVHLAADIRTVYTDTAIFATDMTIVGEMGSSWVRFDIPWYKLEISPGIYEWQTVDVVMDQISAAGLKPLPSIYGAPEWAAPQSCGPVSDTASLESFLAALFTRYRDQVSAWEFTNEPDAKEPFRWGPVIGCWGLEPEAYAEQLGIFYRSVRQYDPGALVVAGGMAYDNWAIFERSFWSKTLEAGAGQFFDVANFHYYPINPVDFPTMAHKVNEIKGFMEANNLLNKRIWVTETGMWVNLNGSVEAQKDFIVREQARGFGAGLDNIFWFDPKERNIGVDQTQRWLFSLEQEPINGYATYQFFASKVNGTISRGQVTDFPTEIEAYRFTESGQELFIAWSNTVTQSLTINASVDVQVSNRDGTTQQTIAPQNGQVTVEVGTAPIFIELITP